jgi:hypothetical protein
VKNFLPNLPNLPYLPYLPHLFINPPYRGITTEVLLNCMCQVGKILIRELFLVTPLHKLNQEGFIESRTLAKRIAWK